MLCPPALARNVSVFMKWSTKGDQSPATVDSKDVLVWLRFIG